MKTGVLKIKFENWKFKNLFENESWKLNLKIENLKNYLKMEVLKIKFGNYNFEKLFEDQNFENWNFEKLFENEIFLKIKFKN